MDANVNTEKLVDALFQVILLIGDPVMEQLHSRLSWGTSKIEVDRNTLDLVDSLLQLITLLGVPVAKELHARLLPESTPVVEKPSSGAISKLVKLTSASHQAVIKLFSRRNGHNVPKLTSSAGQSADNLSSEALPKASQKTSSSQQNLSFPVAVCNDRKMSQEEAQRQLREAVTRDNGQAIEEAVRCGANIEETDNELMTPLCHAAIDGREEALRTLIRLGAQLELEYAPAPLHKAVQNGHENCVVRLLLAGANVGAESFYRWTPLHYAADGGHKKIAKRLVQAGADVNATCVAGLTPLDMAIKMKHHGLASYLRSVGGRRRWD